MSLVIAIKKNNKIYLGADTQWSAGDSKGTTPKIWRVSDKIIMGASGNVRESQIVEYNEIIEELTVVNKKYLVNNFRKRLLEKLKEIDNSEETANSYIICTEENIFKIYSDGTVFSLEDLNQDFIAIGSGMDHANAILKSNKHKDPKERIKEAIETAEHFIRSVNNEVTYLEVGS